MKTLIKNAKIVNEGEVFEGSIIINGEFIEKVVRENTIEGKFDEVIDAKGKYLIPGVIDDQVHFREPGLVHKGEIATESAAAVAGGITSYMEMPNTNPQTTTQASIIDKFSLAAEKSLANFSFYIGATNDNLSELVKTDPKNICGIKVFMGASTGNMLVDNPKALEGIFAEAPCLIATHCEDEVTIRSNMSEFTQKYGDEGILPPHHPLIRSAEACYKSSSKAVGLATKYNSKLHVLHLSTEKELELFTTGSIADKKITAEVCVHHLWFNSDDYSTLGHRIKWNPAVKTEQDRSALFNALLNDKLDVIATDHAPHLISEKLNQYKNSASGGPLVQHALIAMLDFYKKGLIDLSFIVHKMCHAPADLFQINKRGYIKEGYFADVVLVDTDEAHHVSEETILYKCKWSPFEGHTFGSSVNKTFVNGNLVYNNGLINKAFRGQALTFNR